MQHILLLNLTSLFFSHAKYSKTLLCVDRERVCEEKYLCDGIIDCNFLSADDESNCTACPPYEPLRCDCNKEGNYSCKWNGGDGGNRIFSCFHSLGRKYSEDREALFKITNLKTFQVCIKIIKIRSLNGHYETKKCLIIAITIIKSAI